MTTLTQATYERMNDLRTQVRNDLMRVQRMFNKNPNATNWEVCTRAMLVFQQVDWACRSNIVDHVALLLDLDHATVGEWGDIITRATLGMSVASALA
jgi:hypothetical protein